MNIDSIVSEAIEVEKRAKRAGFSKSSASELAGKFMDAKLESLKEEVSFINVKNEPWGYKPEFVSPSEIGNMLIGRGISKKKMTEAEVNKLLADYGLQTKNIKGGWELTKEGRLLSKETFVTTIVKGNTHKSPSRIKWDLDDTVNKLMGLRLNETMELL